jgi:hypothetical protein
MLAFRDKVLKKLFNGTLSIALQPIQLNVRP